MLTLKQVIVESHDDLEIWSSITVWEGSHGRSWSCSWTSPTTTTGSERSQDVCHPRPGRGRYSWPTACIIDHRGSPLRPCSSRYGDHLQSRRYRRRSKRCSRRYSTSCSTTASRYRTSRRSSPANAPRGQCPNGLPHTGNATEPLTPGNPIFTFLCYSLYSEIRGTGQLSAKLKTMRP